MVRAKDTPNFIANRVGIAGMLATIKEAENFGLSYDVVDDLTGKKLGRASSGTFRTADVVGLDTMAHVIKTLQDNLADDPFFAELRHAAGAGRADRRRARWARRPAPASTRRSARTSCAWTRPRPTTCPPAARPTTIVERMLKKPAGRAAEAAARDRATRRRSSCGRSCATPSTTPPCTWTTIADSARDVDFAMRWGFGMKQGPFELWQDAGWQQVAELGQGRHRRRQGAEQARRCRPGCSTAATGVHTPEGSWSAGARHATCRAARLPVYQRQHFPESVLGAGAPEPLKSGTELFKNDEMRLWTLDGEVLIASITSQAAPHRPGVIEGLLKARGAGRGAATRAW